MNSSTLIPKASPSSFESTNEEELDIGRYVEVLTANKWLIAAITLVVFAGGVIFATLQRPVYEGNMVIQVEDTSSTSGKGILQEAGGLVDVKTPAGGEIEILRSRMIASQAAEATKLYIVAGPRYVPYIGGWMA